MLKDDIHASNFKIQFLLNSLFVYKTKIIPKCQAHEGKGKNTSGCFFFFLPQTKLSLYDLAVYTV